MTNNKTEQTFEQWDLWTNLEELGDCVVKPDENGDWFSSTRNRELRRSGSDLVIRLQIVDGTPHEEIKRLLRKLLDGMESGEPFLNAGFIHLGKPTMTEIESERAV